MSVDQAIRVAASDYLGWHYAEDGRPRSARTVPGGPLRLQRTDLDPMALGIDCSTFTAAVLAAAYPSARWSAATYADLQIFDHARPWSPIECVVELGIGRHAEEPERGKWALCQGWRGLEPLSGGHAWLAWGTDAILHASSSERRVTWARRTWAEQRARYGAGTRIALLG